MSWFLANESFGRCVFYAKRDLPRAGEASVFVAHNRLVSNMPAMASRKLEKQLEHLKSMRDAPGGDLDAVLRTCLEDRSNLVVAEAAGLAARHQRAPLVPELLQALDRLFEDPVKTDAKCRGKTAIVKSLAALNHDESPPFLRALQHVQMEPVWGGQEDAAAQLRANAALALVQCSDLGRSMVLRHLVDALADPADPVRVEAVRAIEQMNGEEAVLLLRLKAHSGDRRPHVMGQVFDSLLQLEGERGVEFVRRFVESGDDEVRDEAALALGASRLPAAAAALIDVWRRTRFAEFRAVLLRALSASREESALAFLLNLVKDGDGRDAAEAREALELHKDSPELRQRIAEALRARKQ
jgi:HEAT repeat protein